MIFAEFCSLVDQCPDGVVLLEGRRGIPSDYAVRAENLSRFLAKRFLHLRFRSGNAEGTDEAFSKGVVSVDPSRLQIVAPYASHRKSVRYDEVIYDFPQSLSVLQEEEIAYKTVEATPRNKNLIDARGGHGKMAAKASYLIRDTMKVVGHSADFPKPICALFYVDLEDSSAGGTGHTIRVCEREGVPFAFQDSWEKWEGC